MNVFLRAAVKELRRQGRCCTRSSNRFSKLLLLPYSPHRRQFNVGSKSASAESSYAQPAQNLSQDVSQEEKDHYDRAMAEDKGKQIRAPWHRDGSDTAPVSKDQSAEPLTEGKLLTTPSRMLKLILPLTRRAHNQERNDVEALALLVHPQQPLSYLERLIQSELPTLKKDGRERPPNVYFKAEHSVQENLQTKKATPIEDTEEGEDTQVDKEDLAEPQKTPVDGKPRKTGKMIRKSKKEAAELRGGPSEGGVESYSGLGRDAPSDTTGERNFVRWSPSTEMGDFIRDAARGQQFIIEIEGAPNEIRVGVPSFADRTYYLRMRLRKASRKLATMVDIKRECDMLAHKGAQRVAWAGLAGLGAYWYTVFRLTFKTDLGWDTMEPVTYLVSLSTLIAGYCWFLYHNREVSYRAAMSITISRRQSKLYQQKGFDLNTWESLVDEANMLRKEIKAIANEYDVGWDELADEQPEKVAEVLRKERKKNNKFKDEDEDKAEKAK